MNAAEPVSDGGLRYESSPTVEALDLVDTETGTPATSSTWWIAENISMLLVQPFPPLVSPIPNDMELHTHISLISSSAAAPDSGLATPPLENRIDLAFFFPCFAVFGGPNIPLLVCLKC